MTWSQELTTLLLNEVEKRIELWDTTHKDYKNKLIRGKKIKEIADILQCSSHQIENKIHSLKSQFAREFLLMKRNGKNKQERKWFAFDQMCRLRNSITTDCTSEYDQILSSNDSQSNSVKTYINENNHNDELEEKIDDTLPKESIRKIDKRKRRHKSKDEDYGPLFDEAMDALTQIQENKKQRSLDEDEDETMAFGHCIGRQLKAIKDPFARSVAKLKMQEILFKAETGAYSKENPTIMFN